MSLREECIKWCETNPGAGDETLPVSEQFGPTIQGEGKHAGRAVQFLRLGHCNLSCSWCDTAYTWDKDRFDLSVELDDRTAASIVENLIPGVALVISGGEPLMHQRKTAWAYLLHGAVSRGCEVHVETNGTLAPTGATVELVSHAAVSPKLAHAGDHGGRRAPMFTNKWLTYMQGDTSLDARLKYVVRDGSDVNEVTAITDGLGAPRSAVWVMPLGTSTEELQARWPGVARAAADAHINASHRVHVLAWGDVKGT